MSTYKVKVETLNKTNNAKGYRDVRVDANSEGEARRLAENKVSLSIGIVKALATAIMKIK
ncbi:hypothetical protein JK192_16575 [Gluconobacter cerinus]|uniref:hypothetical protein n=1 Tax=Gluconobacter cerinus TaxID=38307 RepID=UPI001B8B2CD8|nr:hypothetical protein [Gluconobacter cerinus]MBS0984582.1 hypothetical protein [Gluconobacter cerinus]MBS1032964.1 hypothetical protein [Gluconobacter cerinus]